MGVDMVMGEHQATSTADGDEERARLDGMAMMECGMPSLFAQK
jgi:hypothetical protein